MLTTSVPARAGLRRPAGAAVVAAALGWAANVPVLRAVLADAGRGVDAMDESHYLMAAQPWAADKAFNGVFGWYTGPLLRLVGGDIAAFRVLGALVLAAAALALAGAVRRAAEGLAAEAWPAWVRGLWPPASVAASMCYYTVFVRTPSYNWCAAVGLMLLATGLLGVVDAAAAARGDGRLAAWGALLATGSFATAVGKATSGAGATAVALAAVLVLVRPARRLLVAAGGAAAAAVVLVAVHALLVAPIGFSLATYRRVSGMVAVVDPAHYAPGALAGTARAGVRDLLIDRPAAHLWLLALPVVVGVVLVVVGAVRGRRPPAGTALAMAHTVLWWWVLVTTLLDYPGGVSGLGMSAVPPVVGALAALVVAAVLRAGGWAAPGSAPGRAVVLCAALLAMGVAYPLGTNVEYATQLHGGFPVLVAAAVIGLAALPEGAAAQAVASVAVGAVVMAAVLVPLTRERAPYRIAGLEQQTEARDVVRGGPPVWVDEDTAAWIDDLRRAADGAGFAPGTPVLDLTWHPMSVLALGGRAPSVLLPAFPGWPDPGGSAAYALRQEDAAVWRQAWLLVPEADAPSVTDTATQVVGMRFPDDYERVVVVRAPFDRQSQGLWRPRTLSR